MGRKEIFSKRRNHLESDLKKIETSFRVWSYSRLAITFMAVAFVVYFANLRSFEGIVVTVFIYPIVFGLIVQRHNRIKLERYKVSNLVDINCEEILRIEVNLEEFDEGREFIDREHPYTSDLDIFGRHSIFQWINRTSTYFGRNMLAEWLKSPADKSEIEYRQESIKELSDDLDWIQDFQALGRLSPVKPAEVKKLVSWLEEDESPWLKIGILPHLAGVVLMITGITLLGFGLITYGWLIFPLSLNVLLLRRLFQRMKDLMDKTYEGNKAIQSITLLIQKVEDSDFKSKRLKEIQYSFIGENSSAFLRLKKLNKLLDFVNSRANPLFGLIDILTLFDYFLLRALSKWKNEEREKVREWFSMIGMMECLNSLAATSHAEVDLNFPDFVEDEFHFSARSIGHPLIGPQQRINNDSGLKGKGSIAIVTGSNMSGKSTFLRTVGVNLVLAQMGAPVCAESMEFSGTSLFTSMRNSDLLAESVSSFYAELQRLKALLDRINVGEKPVMFMIDEVLKGTNSKDRHLGAESLILQLREMNTFGWVSTHDLELGKLAEVSTGIELFSFNSSIRNGELIFDYKLSKGLCRSFNASILMKKMGIDIPEDQIKSD